MKKRWIFLTGALLCVYFVALGFKHQFWGDMLSPALTLMATAVVFQCFVRKETQKIARISGVFYSLAIGSWLLCDLGWGYYKWILHLNPEDNLWITYGYSLTNLFLLISILVEGIHQLKRWNVRRRITIGCNSKLKSRLTPIRPRGLACNCTFLSA